MGRHHGPRYESQQQYNFCKILIEQSTRILAAAAPAHIFYKESVLAGEGQNSGGVVAESFIPDFNLNC